MTVIPPIVLRLISNMENFNHILNQKAIWLRAKNPQEIRISELTLFAKKSKQIYDKEGKFWGATVAPIQSS